METGNDVIELSTVEGLDELLADGAAVLLFKHSTACPISARAHRELIAWLEQADARPLVARVLVIEDRPVSNAIADRLAVVHQSPQAILVEGGRVTWSASHHGIDVASIRAAVDGLRSDQR